MDNENFGQYLAEKREEKNFTIADVEAEIKALKTLRHYRVAAVMMSHAINAVNGKHVREILGADMPLVQFDRVFPDVSGAKIVGANCQGAYTATKHLVQAGYRRIGTLAGYMSAMPFVERLAGYRLALADAGMPFDNDIVFMDTIVRETGYQACKKALAAGCDALYCAGDFSALGAVDALREMGVSVPDEFGIVGTANETFTSLMTPSLSSLSQHPYEMGQEAARAFLDSRTDTVEIPMDLQIRQSSNKNNKWQK